MRKIGNGDILCDGFSQFYEENDPHRSDRWRVEISSSGLRAAHLRQF